MRIMMTTMLTIILCRQAFSAPQPAAPQPPNIQTEPMPAHVTPLYQKNFTRGTVRLLRSGEYWLAEDIVFNPNPGNRNNLPGGWFPDPADNYPAAPFSLGFFAAITIEGQNIVLNLNGHTLSCSREFQIQQPFGSIIHLASTPFDPHAFEPGDGPGDFGPTIDSAHKATVRNGYLQVAPHHVIHGNNVVGIILEDLEIQDFRVAGVSLNNVTNVKVSRVHIHRSVQDLPILGRYSNARVMLHFLRLIPDRDLKKITFHDGRRFTLAQIERRLVRGMNFLFDWYINGDETVFDHPAFTGEFFNDDGLPDGGALYGVLINGFGVALFGLGDSPAISSDVILSDITVENMALNTREIVTNRWSGRVAGGTSGNVLPFVEIFADNHLADLNTASYVGTLLGDAQFALDKYTTEGDQSQRRVLFIPQAMRDWALTGTTLSSGDFELNCNADSQGHVNKGVFGIRVDGTANVLIERVRVRNLESFGDLGTLRCGEYTVGQSTGAHPRQVFPGYGANTVRGISVVNATYVVLKDADVSRLSSKNGVVYGVDTTNSVVELQGHIRLSRLEAERPSFPPGQIATTIYPNPIPSACGVFYVPGSPTELLERPSMGEGCTVTVTCVRGIYTCNQLNGPRTFVGSVERCE